MLPFFGQGRIPEAIGVFTADLSGGMPSQWTLQVAHVRYFLDLEVAAGTYGMDVGNVKNKDIQGYITHKKPPPPPRTTPAVTAAPIAAGPEKK